MAYVPVPKDLTKVKSKFLFNLTKRQVVCFGLGALAGLPLFFLTKDSLGVSMAAALMILIMLPFFMFAMFERHGQPLEVLLKHFKQWRRNVLMAKVQSENAKTGMAGKLVIMTRKESAIQYTERHRLKCESVLLRR